MESGHVGASPGYESLTWAGAVTQLVMMLIDQYAPLTIWSLHWQRLANKSLEWTLVRAAELCR